MIFPEALSDPVVTVKKSIYKRAAGFIGAPVVIDKVCHPLIKPVV